MPDGINFDQQTRLQELEQIIATNQTQFYEYGHALTEISEQKLYKIKNGGAFKTFEDYCKTVWNLSRIRAYQLIDSAKTVDVLEPVVARQDLNERLVRPLSKLADPEMKVLAYQEAQRHAEVEGRQVTGRHVAVAVERVREDAAEGFSPIIKPTNSWNFSSLVYGRLGIDDGEGEESHGYIPGDLYANALWFYTKPGDVVVEPMAGSGQIWRVWEDRAFWMRPESWELNIYTFDINPRGPYRDRIGKWDLTTGFPIEHADYIFMDVPYWGMVAGQYSNHGADLANQGLTDWLASIRKIAASCVSGQRVGGLCSVMTPNWRDTDDGTIIMTADMVRQAFVDAGYVLFDKAYAPRRIQQAQGPAAAALNNRAKESRILLTEISEVMTFRKG